MPEASLRTDSFVIYKQRPARVAETGQKKITIQTESGERASVRPKDVMLLHPGPLRTLGELKPVPAGDVMAAWELLAGESVTLQELAELAYDEFTPATAWAVWQLVEDGLYFRAYDPAEIEVQSQAHVAAVEAERAAKAAEEAAWAAFAARINAGRYLPEDEGYLQDVSELALRTRDSSRTLQLLGRPETPQAAHDLLLAIGYWDEMVNPYPARFGISTAQPDFPVAELPDEPRRDLTQLAAYAIDDVGNTDPDDAISWDGERFWVHVADVAALIPAESAAEREARDRGANLYLPEGTIHMLPERVTDRLGLGLHEVSPALSFAMRLGDEGEIEDVEITPAWVKVTRLTYEEVDDRLYDPPFDAMRKVLARRTARRARNGAIELSFPEAKVRVSLDDDGPGQVSITPLERTASRDLVREAMLLAGEAVARYALEHEIPIPFTVQDAPALDEGAELRTETPADMYATRRMLNPGRQVSEPAPHSGLGLDLYVQVTSPLRRYHDMLTHQQLRAFLRDEPLLDAETVMTRTTEARERVRSVRITERLSISHWTMVYLRRHPDWRGPATVLDQRGSRTVVSLPDLALETEIYGRADVAPNDEVEVALSSVDLPAPSAVFRFV